jgi:hypothetical protein
MIRDPTTIVSPRRSMVRVLVFLVALPSAFAAAQVPREKNLTPSTPKAIACPAAGLSTPQILQQSAGHHTVTLTWKANAASTNRATNTVGYCLYRRKRSSIPKKISDCKDCELVSPVPIAGTGCVDNSVQDGVTYYYVVTAANESSRISDSSNEAPAEIPLTETATPGAVSSYPLCRPMESGKAER